MDENKLLLTLEIDGRKYPLRINKDEEEAYRKAAKNLNIRIDQYRARFGGKSDLDTQDYVVLTALEMAAENFSLEKRNDTKPFEDTISILVEELDNFLKK